MALANKRNKEKALTSVEERIEGEDVSKIYGPESVDAPAKGKGNKGKGKPAKAGKGKAKEKTKIKIPRTVQQTLAWECCYDNGVFKIGPKTYSKTFEFDDVSFKTKSDEDQDAIYEGYMRFLNLISDEEDIFITFVNYREDEKKKLLNVLPQRKGDGLDEYRDEISDILKHNMRLSRNNISTRRFITVIVTNDNLDAAMSRINVLGGELEANFKKIAGSQLRGLDLAERLEILNTILNGLEENFWFLHDKKGKVSIDYDRMSKQGRTTKDIIAPSGMKFSGNYFEIGERLGQSMYLDGLANWQDSNYLTSLTEVNFESVFTMHINALNQTEAIKRIHNQSINITAELEEKQLNAGKKGYDPSFVSTDLQKAKQQIDLLQEDITNRDQRLFMMSLCLTHFAEDKETLDDQTKTIKNLGAKYMTNIKPLTYQQERGFMSSLPLGHDYLYKNMLLTTESLGVFIPFNEVNQFDAGGIYYGVNAINKSLIIYNRAKGQNYNGLVLGASGSGKSFSAKREMTNAILNTEATVYIIDPDGEYTPLADAFGGAIVKIVPGGNIYLNPLDLDIDNSYDSDLNPITLKSDFICGLLETMAGTGARLTPIQKSIVDQCIQEIYRPYLEYLAELPPDRNGRKITIDRAKCPTLVDLFDALFNKPSAEAQNLAITMQMYTTGNFDTFAHRTNIPNLDKNGGSPKLVVYDIKNIGSNLRELGLKVCLNEVWNNMLLNRRDNKWTWFYIDEFHLLLSSESAASFLKSIWKRARKFQGVPTGITQNVEDLLASSESRAIINNTSFVYMLNQSFMDRAALKDLLNLSAGDIEYITNVEPGHGLIYTGSQTIPFEDNFPSNTALFKVMTTKAEEE